MATDDKDRLDKWLDSALKQYGNVEPQVGLESRITANLEARSRFSTRLGWAFATAVVVVCIILVGVWHHENTVSGTKDAANIWSLHSERATPVLNENSVHIATRTAPAMQRRHTPRTPYSIAPAHSRRFPSPRPLTDRELTLAEYAKSFPKEAELIAQEQQTFDQEMQREQLLLQNQSQSSFEER